eukprot:EG_transcript_27915
MTVHILSCIISFTHEHFRETDKTRRRLTKSATCTHASVSNPSPWQFWAAEVPLVCVQRHLPFLVHTKSAHGVAVFCPIWHFRNKFSAVPMLTSCFIADPPALDLWPIGRKPFAECAPQPAAAPQLQP